jgi:exodeoxyribonuclease-5
VSIILNPDQQQAKAEILAAREAGTFQLLTGFAGSGKTTLMQHLAAHWDAGHVDVVLTAPTHKAVSVLSRKLRQSGLMTPCLTIHSLLSLTPKPHGDRLVFERKKKADPVHADVVVIDECSMISADLMRHIRRHLPVSFVLFVGDPAQLPPVGEELSQTFGVKRKSHLSAIVRQAAENPILNAADTIRNSQGKGMDWTWMHSAKAPPLGVYIPADPDHWMRKAFTSDEFANDPDTFRYLCWTNEQVGRVNQKVRHWIYGETKTPFMQGERALFRAPVFAPDGKTPLISTNEEATVLDIEPNHFRHPIPQREMVAPWVAEVPTWRVRVLKDDGQIITTDTPRDVRAYNAVLARIADEAGDTRERWGDHHAFKQRLASMQNIYAMTVHTSQGSTFGNAFVDVSDIRRRASSNVLETQQLLYVAVTRPTDALVLVQ